MVDHNVLEACKAALAAWQQAFNGQDAQGCAAQYAKGCVMDARPFGVFEGRDAIENFWQGIIDQGINDVNYTDVSWEPEGDDGYILTAKWTMNKAFGVVHKEHWAMQSDGSAKLVSDCFEVQGER